MTSLRSAVSFPLLALVLLLPASPAWAQSTPLPDPPPPGVDVASAVADHDADHPGSGPAAEAPPVGLIRNEPGVSPGYVLFSPLKSTDTFLVDNQGEVLHTWPSRYAPGSLYLLDDGSLLRCARLDDPAFFAGGGIYGLLERLGPDGEVLWSYELANEQTIIHHDMEPLPNGNILFMAWERKQPREVLGRGRHPAAVGERGLWPDTVFELKPTLPSGGEIVWQWHTWDHLVQDLDPKLPDHAEVADHPGRLDVNGDHRDQAPLSAEELAKLDEVQAQMRALGYVGGKDETDEEKDRRKEPDWLHTNAVDYHAGLDLILLSSPNLSEIFVIDHSTTTAQAAGSSGGRWGHGGDLLWRWGNPRRYGAGDDDQQQLFYQHDPQWLDGSNAGAAPGHEGQAIAADLRLTVFNNGGGRPGGDHSSVDELVLPFDPALGFVHEPGVPFGPAAPAWTFADPGNVFSPFISGAQRLPNGNTLLCEGISGRLLEVTRDGRIVWEYRSPFTGDQPAPKGTGGVPPLAVFRCTRYAPDHPGVVALLGEG